MKNNLKFNHLYLRKVENRVLNIGIRKRFVIIMAELLSRIIQLCYDIFMLFIQILLMFGMIFKQKAFDFFIDFIRKNINDNEK